MAPGQINQEIYRTRHALHFHTLQECISKYSNAQIKECNSKHRPNNPMRAGSTKLGITRMHFQTLKCTDQGMQLQTSPQQCNSKHRPNNSAPFPATQPNNSAHFPTRALPNSTYRTRKTTPTETRTRSKVRSLPPHLHTVSLHLLYYVTFRELPSIPLIR